MIKVYNGGDHMRQYCDDIPLSPKLKTLKNSKINYLIIILT